MLIVFMPKLNMQGAVMKIVVILSVIMLYVI
jgi:hypothetical protein